MNLILASASPRRKELIKRIGNLHVQIVPSNAEEVADRSDPLSYAVKLAELKATAVFKQTGGTVLGADTVVTIDGEILEKPHSFAEAEAMLRKLCGRTHEVITGLCIINENKKVLSAETSYVTFGQYDAPLVNEYIISGSPFDKAGGYGIQDEAIAPLVEQVKGDIDNVIGLPVKKVEQLLMQFGR